MFKKILLLTCCLSIVFGAQAVPADGIFPWKKKKEAQADTTATKKKSDYEKFFKEKHTTTDGLIKMHKMEEKLYFEFPLNLLGRDMLLGSTVSEISDNNNAIIGSKPTEPLLIQFTKTGDKIELRQVDCTAITDTTDRNIAQSLKKNTIGAILKTFKIETYSEDSSAVVFDITDFFVSDNEDLTPFDVFSLNNMLYDRTKSFQSDRSFLGEIKAFKDNVIIKSHLSYTYSLSEDGTTVARDVPFTAVMTRSIILLPEQPYRPRIADYRMAIFPTGKMKFTSDDQYVKIVYYANRWKLEPSDMEAYKRGEKVTPKKPIVFYLDNTFPEKWKAHIREGVEQWNELFGEIGFKEAIQAKDFPTDDPEFDPDNIKYSCIRYAPIGIANAMGPSWVDPRSGEIINASVYVYHDIIQLLNNWIFVQTAPVDKRVRTTVIPDEVMGDGLRYVIAHEVGHCLGFMHNMSASSVIPVDSLRSPSFTQKYGTTTSIMDYARYNYVAQPGDMERGVKITPPRFGEYDRFLLKWSYTPLPDTKTAEEESEILSGWIAEKAGDPIYRYGKQQGFVLDPKSQTEDLGDDAVKASEYGVKNLKYLMTNFDSWVDTQDTDYAYRLKIFNQIISQYMMYISHVYGNVGGVYMNEKKVGDPVEAFESVPKEKQKRALQFLMNQFADLEWFDNRELMQKMTIMGAPKELIANAIGNAIISAPSKVVFSANLSDDPFSFDECAEMVYNFVWKSTLSGKTPTDKEKRLQKNFVTSFCSNAQLGGLSKKSNAAAAAELFHNLTVPGITDGNSHEYCCQGFSQENNPVAGFGSFRAIFHIRPYDINSAYYAYIVKVQNLLKSKRNSASNEAKQHYDLLLYNIDQILK